MKQRIVWAILAAAVLAALAYDAPLVLAPIYVPCGYIWPGWC